jgi:peptide/nickel transport system substrate-binding protein
MLRAPRRRGAPRQRRSRRGLAAAAAAAALALLAAACGSGSVAAGGNTPVSGGTAAWALQPTSAPNFIFPFDPAENFTITNINYFQELMYRPLYWFGTGNQPTMNQELSLAFPPVYHGQTVTIRLKGNYRWSDGSPVDARDLVFWMHMMIAEKANWGGYVQGAFPDNISDVKAVGADTVTMVIKGSYSPLWFTDNELSQVTPMPKAWDRTKSGPSNCAAVIADCAAVWSYLTAQAQDTSHYVGSKIWGVVDGPWRLASFNTDGHVSFTFNKSYSGKLPAHHIDTFVEVPFTTEQSEYNVLQAGGTLDVGYLPTVDAPVPAAGAAVGENPLRDVGPGYNLAPLYSWGLNYMPFDFNNPTAGPIFKQLYFRQAFQYLVDQEGVIDGPLHGYGKASVGPVGDVPVTSYLSTEAKRGDPFSLNPSAATKLLTEHGWNVSPNSLTTCTSPGSGTGQCGPGIHQGQGLSFTLNYVSGISWVQSASKELASNAAEVGIKITLKDMSFGDVITAATACLGRTTPSPKCTWQLADWGNGWSYSPDYLPTGENLFKTGSVDNFGGFSDSHNDELTDATMHASAGTFMKAFHQWEDYLASQIPVVMEPAAPFNLVETVSNLRTGVQAPTLTLTPEDWYFVK